MHASGQLARRHLARRAADGPADHRLTRPATGKRLTEPGEANPAADAAPAGLSPGRARHPLGAHASSETDAASTSAGHGLSLSAWVRRPANSTSSPPPTWATGPSWRPSVETNSARGCARGMWRCSTCGPSRSPPPATRRVVSIPINELTRRLRELSKDRTIVANCRGPYCVYADDAVRTCPVAATAPPV
jgi:hypothetical protein